MKAIVKVPFTKQNLILENEQDAKDYVKASIFAYLTYPIWVFVGLCIFAVIMAFITNYFWDILLFLADAFKFIAFAFLDSLMV